MGEYRVGIIGCGRMGSTIDDEVGKFDSTLLPYSHAASYSEVPQTHPVAAAELIPEKLEDFGRRWGVTALYADYHEMLEKEDLDIVSVTTHTVERCQITLDVAAARPKAVFCEKPLATTLSEADRMIDACRKVGAKLAVNCSRRWHPYYIRAREVIESGQIGTLNTIAAYCAGRLSHMGSHLLDIVRYFADDEVEWVFGHMNDDEVARSDEDPQGSGYLWFRNGVRAFINMSGGNRLGVELDLIGDEGRVRIINNGGRFELWTAEPEGRGLVEHQFPMPQRVKSFGAAAVEDIITCIETGKEPECSGQDGRAVLEIALAMRESHRGGGSKIFLPLEDSDLRIIAV